MKEQPQISKPQISLSMWGSFIDAILSVPGEHLFIFYSDLNVICIIKELLTFWLETTLLYLPLQHVPKRDPHYIFVHTFLPPRILPPFLLAICPLTLTGPGKGWLTFGGCSPLGISPFVITAHFISSLVESLTVSPLCHTFSSWDLCTCSHFCLNVSPLLCLSG